VGATAEEVLKKALHLSAVERAAVAESLLSSLDQPDPGIDQLWAKEAEAGVDAADRGEMEIVSEDDVFAKYDSP